MIDRKRTYPIALIALGSIGGCAIAFGSTGGTAPSGTGDGSPAVMHGVIPFAILIAAALVMAIVWWDD